MMHASGSLKRPRLVIAGTGSGAGKTTITLGLMRAFADRGLQVQGFKCGPDYIDPTYHTAVTGRPSRNLDSWMTSSADVHNTFCRVSEGSDLSIIEGVMGLYDGKDPSSNTGSTAEIAMLTDTPVLLVVDVRSMARSAAAIVLGFQQLEPGLRIAGVIVNRCGSAGHYKMVKTAIEQMCGVPVLGWLPRDEQLHVPERHLGLVPAVERGELEPLFQQMAARVAEGADLDKIFALACAASPLEPQQQQLSHADGMPVEDIPPWSAQEDQEGSVEHTPNHTPDTGQKVSTDSSIHRGSLLPRNLGAESTVLASGSERPVIAVARDAAFNFYYEDNLELLQAAGAAIAYFSPLAGERIPEAASGVYLGGGFPEEFAAAIAANHTFLKDLRRAAEQDMPIFAECGGYMVLARTLTDRSGQPHTMAGLIPADVRMQERRAALGYREAKALQDCLLLKAGETLRGHEFHYSVMSFEEETYSFAYETKGLRGSTREGYASGRLMAGYTHIHLASHPPAAERWVEACAAFAAANQ